jgi:hypothetical protein
VTDIACDECGLTMDQTRLLASVRDGEVVVVPMDIFKEMLDQVPASALVYPAANALLPSLFDKD